MGRYAFFNTGLEYKFRFGEQSSYDMQEFGGREIAYDDNDIDHRHHEWIQEDRHIPEFNLIKSEIDLNKYEKNLEGTYSLCYDLYDLDVSCTYRLGCLIYHQLLYTEVLTCRYEV